MINLNLGIDYARIVVPMPIDYSQTSSEKADRRKI